MVDDDMLEAGQDSAAYICELAIQPARIKRVMARAMGNEWGGNQDEAVGG